MATPLINPYNLYIGNDSATEFAVGFPYTNREQVHVYLKRYDASEVELTSSDYEFLSDTVIKFPATGSSEGILRTNDKIAIQRETPCENEYVFNNQKRLFPEDVMEADDKSYRILQEMNRKLERAVMLNPTSTEDPSEIFNNLVEEVSAIEELARESAETAETAAESAAESAETAEQYANNVKFGMKRVEVKAADWQQVGAIYKIFVPDVGVIFDVYKKDGSVYDKVDCNIQTSDNGATIESVEAFAGYYLVADTASQQYIHDQTVAATTWTIEHNLGKYPAVTCIDGNGYVLIATVQYTGLNTVVLTFTEATTGKAILN